MAQRGASSLTKSPPSLGAAVEPGAVGSSGNGRYFREMARQQQCRRRLVFGAEVDLWPGQETRGGDRITALQLLLREWGVAVAASKERITGNPAGGG